MERLLKVCLKKKLVKMNIKCIKIIVNMAILCHSWKLYTVACVESARVALRGWVSNVYRSMKTVSVLWFTFHYKENKMHTMPAS